MANGEATNGNGKFALLKWAMNAGVGAVTALFLGYALWLTWTMALPKVDTLVVKVEAISEEHKEMKETLTRQYEINQRMLRAICLNTAETKEDQLRCN